MDESDVHILDIGDESKDEDPVNFLSNSEFALELPDEEGQKTDVLVMSVLNRNLMILKSFYSAKGRVRCSAVDAPEEIKKVLAGTVKARLSSKYDGKVVRINGTNKAVILMKSNTLRYIGVLGTFKPGHNDAKYSVFCKVPGKGVMVNSDGYYIKGVEPYMIASASCVENIKEGWKDPIDVVAMLEKKYVIYLQIKYLAYKHLAQEYFILDRKSV